MTSVLFVCLGNICRSPTAEAVLRAMAPELDVDSAGTADWHIGQPPYVMMEEAAAARGYDLSRLSARQVTRADFDRFDLILAMDPQNLSDLRAIGGDRPHVRLFLDGVPKAGTDTVPDPYYTRDFDAALDLIELGCRNLLAEISGRPAPPGG